MEKFNLEVQRIKCTDEEYKVAKKMVEKKFKEENLKENNE